MSDPSVSQTSPTLLARVARTGVPDQAAWALFVERYGRKVYHWCLRWKLQEADAQDVTQVVLLKLATKMKEFEYDSSRSFRAWLKTVAHHAWRDFVESKLRAGVGQGNSEGQAWFQTVEARESLIQGLEEQFDFELLEQALETVRPRVAANNWEAFRMTALEGLPAADAAQKLGMRIARVYAARSTIQQMLQQECHSLENQQCPSE